MKTVFSSFIFVLIFYAAAFSQNDKLAPCPAISITGQTDIPQENKPQTFTATVGSEIENFSVQYEWSASAGEIIEGQGTLSIKVLQKEFSSTLIVTLEAKGLPENCAHTFSESLNYCDLSPQALLIEKLSEPIEQIEKAEVFDKPSALNADANAQLYIIFRYKKNTLPKTIVRTERKLFNNLIKAGVERERITLIKGSAETESIEFWLVVPGASIPQINQ